MPTDDTPRIFITGGYGCIGAETAKWIVNNTASQVVIGGRTVSKERTDAVFGDTGSERMTFLEVDVRDSKRLSEIITDHRITHIAHLAGLQTPDCNANRDLGLQVNLAGTQNLIEAVKETNTPLKRFAFASSIAVYGPRSAYPPGQVPMLSQPKPVNVYGTWKLAGEHVARLFAKETGIPTLSIRPGVLFGPGRDAGLTSTTTTAMKMIAANEAYEIPFCNRQDYLYAPDVGAAFGNALLEPFDGYAAFTLPCHCVDTETVVDAMGIACEELNIHDQFKITVGQQEVPFICELEFQPFLTAFPNVPHTPLQQAVKQSIESFLASQSKA